MEKTLNVISEPENQPKENILGTKKIGSLLAKFAIPGIVSMVVNAFYNIIDQIFIGHGVGYLGNGATSVIFPLTTLAMAFALLFGDGAAAYMSLKQGEKKPEEAKKGTAAGILGFAGVGLILGILFVIFIKPLSRAFGASEGILPYAVDYGSIIAMGIPFMAICAGGSSIIRADGSPLFNMIGLFTGTIINLVLDPITIFVFKWGVQGAAVATILGQFANAALNIFYITRKMKSTKLDKEAWAGAFSHLGAVARLGISSFITQMSLVVAIALRNNILSYYGAQSKYGPDIPVTTLGITMKTFSIIMSIIIGLAAGSQPILGYNYGAGNYGRVKKTFKLVCIISTSICIVAFLLAQFAPMAIISIFGQENDLYNEFAVKCMRIYLMLIPLVGIQISSGIFFQALGYPAQASFLSLSKQIIFQLPVTIILPLFLGVEGVLWTGPLSDILAFTATVVTFLIYWPRIFKKSKED